MSYTVFNPNGKHVADIRSLRMTREAAKAMAVKWFGAGSSVRVER